MHAPTAAVHQGLSVKARWCPALQGGQSYFSKFSFLFHLKNHYSKDVKLKFLLKRFSHFDWGDTQYKIPYGDVLPTCYMSWVAKSRGGPRILRQMGMYCSNGLLFYKKSLNVGPVFYKKILKHESNFLTEPKFSGFRI